MRVLIAGGGIGGLTAALAVTRFGHEAIICEQADSLAEAGAGLQLSPNCVRVLYWLGLEEPLADAGFLPQATQFKNWRTGKVISENPLGETVHLRYGFPYINIHRGDLLSILAQAVADAEAIQLKTGPPVTACTHDADKVMVTAGGEPLVGDILVGADGIHSQVNKLLWGASNPRFTGNVAWRALVDVSRLPTAMVKPNSTV